MKTQLIPLESHDDLISVRDRMSWAKTPRILLIWPTTERVSLRPLDLKVLQRHAASLGAQLGLVTRQGDMRREAQALDIPVFHSTGEAQRHPWPERAPIERPARRIPRRDLRSLRKGVRVEEPAWRAHPLTRLLAFLLGVLAVLSIASLFIPHARVSLRPESEVQTVTLPLQADPDVTRIFITGSLPSRQVELIVEGGQEAQSTGRIPVPQTHAGGRVTFRNLTEDPVTIPEGTLLTSTGIPGVRFLTQEEEELPGGLGSTVEVPVVAEQAGSSGNVAAETILAVEGTLGLYVAVSNAEPTSGGRDQRMKAATEQDHARLREELLDDLEQDALEQLEATLEMGDQVFVDSLQVEQVLEERYDPPLGQAGRQFSLHMRVEYSAFYAAGEDLRELVRTVLNASTPQGYRAVDDSLEFEPAGPMRTGQDGITRWQLRASRRIEKAVEARQVVSLIQGLRPEAAQVQLAAGLPLAGQPEIQLTPSWWPWLPLVPLNISVETVR